MSRPAAEQEIKTPADTNELEETLWAVVSFERVEASSLTYDQAARKLRELDKAGVPGLCVITATAADRIKIPE